MRHARLAVAGLTAWACCVLIALHGAVLATPVYRTVPRSSRGRSGAQPDHPAHTAATHASSPLDLLAEGLLRGGDRLPNGHRDISRFRNALGELAAAGQLPTDLLVDIPWAPTQMVNPALHHVFFKYFTTRDRVWRDILLLLCDAGLAADVETFDILAVDPTPMLLTAFKQMSLDPQLQMALINAGVDLRVFGDSSGPGSSPDAEGGERHGLSVLHVLFSMTAAEVQKQVLGIYKTASPFTLGFRAPKCDLCSREFSRSQCRVCLVFLRS